MNAALRLAALSEPLTPAEWFDLLTEQEKVALYDDFVWWHEQTTQAFTAWLENHKDYLRETGGAEE